MMEWDDIGSKYKNVGSTTERMVTLFGEPKPFEVKQSVDEQEAELASYSATVSKRNASGKLRREAEGQRKRVRAGKTTGSSESEEEGEEEESEGSPESQEDDDVSMNGSGTSKETRPRPLSAQLQYAIKLARGGNMDS